MVRLAQRANHLFYVADLGDFEAEVLAHLNGIAEADGFVVDHQLEGFIAAFRELDDRAGAEAQHFGKTQSAFGELDDHRHFQMQNPPKLVRSGRCGYGVAIGL